MRKLYYLAIAIPIAIVMAYIILFHPIETFLETTYTIQNMARGEDGCIIRPGMMYEEGCFVAMQRIITVTLVCNRYEQYFSTHVNQFFGKYECNQCSIRPPYQSICPRITEADKAAISAANPHVLDQRIWRGPGSHPNEVLISPGSDIPPGSSSIGLFCADTDKCFVPSRISIEAGQTVSWVNGDTVAHTITGGNPKEGPDGTFYSDSFPRGFTFEATFETEGVYDYYCRLHPWMTGSVDVS